MTPERGNGYRAAVFDVKSLFMVLFQQRVSRWNACVWVQRVCGSKMDGGC